MQYQIDRFSGNLCLISNFSFSIQLRFRFYWCTRINWTEETYPILGCINYSIIIHKHICRTIVKRCIRNTNHAKYWRIVCLNFDYTVIHTIGHKIIVFRIHTEISKEIHVITILPWSNYRQFFNISPYGIWTKITWYFIKEKSC